MMTPHLFISKLVALMTKYELPTLNAEETSIDLDVVLASLAERLNREVQLDEAEDIRDSLARLAAL